MASISKVREALEETIKEALPNISVYDTVPDVTHLPAAVVMPDRANFAIAMGRGTDEWRINLYMLVARTETRTAQRQLDEYVTGAGENSIREILFDNPAVGLDDGTDVFVAGLKDYGGEFNTARIPHVGACMLLTVRTPGFG